MNIIEVLLTKSFHVHSKSLQKMSVYLSIFEISKKLLFARKMTIIIASNTHEQGRPPCQLGTLIGEHDGEFDPYSP